MKRIAICVACLALTSCCPVPEAHTEELETLRTAIEKVNEELLRAQRALDAYRAMLEESTAPMPMSWAGP